MSVVANFLPQPNVTHLLPENPKPQPTMSFAEYARRENAAMLRRQVSHAPNASIKPAPIKIAPAKAAIAKPDTGKDERDPLAKEQRILEAMADGKPHRISGIVQASGVSRSHVLTRLRLLIELGTVESHREHANGPVLYWLAEVHE